MTFSFSFSLRFFSQIQPVAAARRFAIDLHSEHLPQSPIWSSLRRDRITRLCIYIYTIYITVAVTANEPLTNELRAPLIAVAAR